MAPHGWSREDVEQHGFQGDDTPGPERPPPSTAQRQLRRAPWATVGGRFPESALNEKARQCPRFYPPPSAGHLAGLEGKSAGFGVELI